MQFSALLSCIQASQQNGAVLLWAGYCLVAGCDVSSNQLQRLSKKAETSNWVEYGCWVVVVIVISALIDTCLLDVGCSETLISVWKGERHIIVDGLTFTKALKREAKSSQDNLR